ncbi:hypothetical protein V1478_009077 [Vespula squamosa]|uniref:Uncharacterized protein n=1 Tax=Vespula squamosa TaxID=30214 RepID=A0ABD2ANM9_VESSQ
MALRKKYPELLRQAEKDVDREQKNFTINQIYMELFIQKDYSNGGRRRHNNLFEGSTDSNITFRIKEAGELRYLVIGIARITDPVGVNQGNSAWNERHGNLKVQGQGYMLSGYMRYFYEVQQQKVTFLKFEA